MSENNSEKNPLTKQKKAVVIGSGFGGLSLANRLQAMGFETTVLEKLDKPGGRAYQKVVQVPNIGEFKFDMGPTVLTVPSFIEEIFSLQKGDLPNSKNQDFTDEALEAIKISSSTERIIGDFSNSKSKNNLKSATFSETENTKNYVDIRPIFPFYRIYFSDGTFFDYDGDYENTIKQIRDLTESEEEVEGFKKFHLEALEVFKKGFLELGYTHFRTSWDIIKIIPLMMKLDVVRSLFSYIYKYFKHPKTQQLFSFEPLLIGGNPYSVPAIYVMIHFVEKTWGVHYAMGGTGALINGFVKKFEELGGDLKLNSEVEEILVEKKTAKGVRLKTGEILEADIVCSNADYAHTYSNLIKKPKFWNNDFKVKKMTKYSMSLFVIYFAFKKDSKNPVKLKHHNIILGGEYEKELDAIFNSGEIYSKHSQYLHIPTYTDFSMAPDGYHTAYTLICVPNKAIKNHDWKNKSEEFKQKVLDFIEDKGYIPNLKNRLVYASYINPDYFENNLNSIYGNAFGTLPILRQSAFFRPQNKSRDIKNLYCVGAGYQPGAGTPSVMMSAKMTARIVADDL